MATGKGFWAAAPCPPAQPLRWMAALKRPRDDVGDSGRSWTLHGGRGSLGLRDFASEERSTLSGGAGRPWKLLTAMSTSVACPSWRSASRQLGRSSRDRLRNYAVGVEPFELYANSAFLRRETASEEGMPLRKVWQAISVSLETLDHFEVSDSAAVGFSV